MRRVCLNSLKMFMFSVKREHFKLLGYIKLKHEHNLRERKDNLYLLPNFIILCSHLQNQCLILRYRGWGYTICSKQTISRAKYNNIFSNSAGFLDWSLYSVFNYNSFSYWTFILFHIKCYFIIKIPKRKELISLCCFLEQNKCKFGASCIWLISFLIR